MKNLTLEQAVEVFSEITNETDPVKIGVAFGSARASGRINPQVDEAGSKLYSQADVTAIAQQFRLAETPEGQNELANFISEVTKNSMFLSSKK